MRSKLVKIKRSILVNFILTLSTLESHKGFVHTNRLRDVYIQSENVLYIHFIFEDFRPQTPS